MRAAATLTLLLCYLTPGWAQTYTREDFAKELERWEGEVDVDPGSAAAKLPLEWAVLADGHRYSVSPAPLKDALNKRDKTAAHVWLRQVRRHVESLPTTPGGENTPAQARASGALKAILARPEFGEVAPPSAWDLFLARIRAWIREWLESIFAYAAQHPTGSQVLFWTLMVAGVGALGWWLMRFLIRAEGGFHLPKPPMTEFPLTSWQEWLAAARGAEAKGDHRQAIRCAYWSAVARLQQEDRAIVNFADTPRERLRALARPALRSGILPSEKLTPLTGITTVFERCWYAKVPVGPDEVAQCFANLEAMGCRAN